jgi:catechol 2,3-dioxygenase-like lactoylglutathione lyase family enzyme
MSGLEDGEFLAPRPLRGAARVEAQHQASRYSIFGEVEREDAARRPTGEWLERSYDGVAIAVPAKDAGEGGVKTIVAQTIFIGSIRRKGPSLRGLRVRDVASAVVARVWPSRTSRHAFAALSLRWVKSYIAPVNRPPNARECRAGSGGRDTSVSMKLPFFRSRKRKAKEAEAELAAAAAPAAEPAAKEEAPPETKAASTRSRRMPAEQVVDAIGFALAAVPSLGPTIKAWRKLGFAVSEPYTWEGCQAAHIELEGGGIRFVAADAQTTGAAPDLVRSRLIVGAGLFGWTWHCSEPHRSALAIGQLAGSEFHADCEDWNDTLVQIPMDLTPAAATWLEKPTAEFGPGPSHANLITRLDHLVLQVSASKATSQTYEKHFGLKGRTSAMNDRYYSFLKAGASLLEIVGPAKPAPPAPGEKPGRVTGGPWGVAFASTNLDATVAFLRAAGVDVGDPNRAVQGGRITGMPAPLGGIQLAFMGD